MSVCFEVALNIVTYTTSLKVEYDQIRRKTLERRGLYLFSHNGSLSIGS